jgi:hypothetical protein
MLIKIKQNKAKPQHKIEITKRKKRKNKKKEKKKEKKEKRGYLDSFSQESGHIC